MPYVAEKDVSLPRVIARGTDPEGREYQETESVVYPAGSVVQEDDIAPGMLERLEAGDSDHLSSLVKHVSEKEAEKILSERADAVAVVPEHEAEAEVLAQDGQDVATREEVVESNPNGDPPAAEEDTTDDTEGRKSEDDESIRSTEVDAARRGKKPAPKAKPAAGKKSSSRGKKKDEEEGS